MESGDILDSQLSASSEGQWTLDGKPFLMSASNGRLNNDGLASCWESAQMMNINGYKYTSVNITSMLHA